MSLAEHQQFTHLFNAYHAQAEMNDSVLFMIRLDQIRALYLLGTAVETAQLLQQLYKRLCCEMGGQCCVQLAENEWLMWLTACGAECGERLKQQMLAILHEPLEFAGQSIYLTATITWVNCPQQATTVDDAIRAVLVAQELATHTGGNVALRYEASPLMQRTESQLKLSLELQTAIIRQQFRLLYQPKIDRMHRICGVEALIRWQHPQLGWLSPQMLVEYAERSGAILDIGYWVLEHACQQIAIWREQGHQFYPVAVNLSAVQFEHPPFLQRFDELMARYHISPHELTIEITETATFHAFETSEAVLQQLSARGIRLALDDFGNGYSSLYYVSRLKIDEIKIDRLLICDLLQQTRHQMIVQSLINFARRIGITLVAEGVETAEQAEWLFQRGCDQIQGFWFSRPLCADEIVAHHMPNRFVIDPLIKTDLSCPSVEMSHYS